MCTPPSADPDGDGFGWQDNATCTVDNIGPTVPGDSYNTALAIQLNESISASMDGIESHHFRIDVPLSTAYSIATNFLIDGELRVCMNTGQYTDQVYSSSDWENFDSSPKGCLQAGTYYLVVVRDDYFTFNNIDYNISLNEADMTCKEPSSTVTFPVFSESTAFRNDIFYYSDFSTLTAADITGATLWNADVGSFYIGNITPLDDDTVLVSHDTNNFHLFDSLGQLKWKTPLGKRYNSAASIHEIGNSVLIDIAGTLYSLDKSDASIRWANTHGQYSFADSEIVVTNDNRIVFINNGQAQIFDN